MKHLLMMSIVTSLSLLAISTPIFADEATSSSFQQSDITKFEVLQNVLAPTITDSAKIEKRLRAIEDEVGKIFAKTKSQKKMNEYLEEQGFIIVSQR